METHQRGRKGAKAETESGHSIGYTPSDTSGKVHAVGSIITQLSSGEGLDDGVDEHNVRYHKIAGHSKRTLLFLVDTSGSMLSAERLAMVKGCVVSLLKDAYVKRTRVGIIGFGGREAHLVLPFTTSPEMAATRIDHMPGGGTTPLLDALAMAAPLIEAETGSALEVVLLSDGRYNRPAGVPVEKKIREFGSFCQKRDVPIHLIDVGSGTRTSKKRCVRLAVMLHATYRALDDMRADSLVDALT